MPRKPIITTLARPFKALFDSDAFAGVLLIAVAVAAMVVANSGLAHAYHALFHTQWWPSSLFKLNTAHLWINDALMAVFFFVVGLEVKRELVVGNLSDARLCPRWSIWESPGQNRVWRAAGRSRRPPISTLPWA